MLVDCKLKMGQVERCLIDRNWSGVLEVLFAAYGSHNIVWIHDVDDIHLTWTNVVTDYSGLNPKCQLDIPLE